MMKNYFKALGMAAIVGLLGTSRGAVFTLYVLPEPFPEEGKVLLFGDGDPVATTVDEWHSIQLLKLDPYENFSSARIFSHAASEDGRNGTNFVSIGDPTRVLSGELNDSGVATPASDNAGSVTPRIALTAVPEPATLGLALLGGTLVFLWRARRGAAGRWRRL